MSYIYSMDMEFIVAAIRLALTTFIGGLIGLERVYNSRAAGFRNHLILCLASALLMQRMQFQWQALPPEQLNTVRVDPTRMAQGIKTGIGFRGRSNYA